MDGDIDDSVLRCRNRIPRRHALPALAGPARLDPVLGYVAVVDKRVAHDVGTSMRQTHVVIGGADRVVLPMIAATEAEGLRRKVVTSMMSFCPSALMAKLSISKLTVYQSAFGPGATDGGFDATGCGGVWAQAASKEMAPAATSKRRAIVRRDI